MAAKEAKARIKINKLLEEASWRFFDDENGKANIALETNVKLSKSQVDTLGSDFESVRNGYVDFLLLDERGFPIAVLEAKSEDKDPLIGKEQARRYAKSQNCRFILLSNGNLHYFWDLTQGNPEVISRFPTPDSIGVRNHFQPNPARLYNELVAADYIVLTQLPGYANEVGWNRESERPDFIEKNKLRFLRLYQQRAIHALQDAVKKGQNRFLFEMATGTGKTLTSAAIIKLFLRTGNAKRILFLVDRLELEDQADKAFKFLLKNDYKSVIYKEQRDDWRKAEIVVTTVQSLLFNNKYRRLFSPTDFDLVISDEAHRSIGGNARAVFEYFVGYKLGLTATPKDYLKRVDSQNADGSDPRDLERRLLLDTYRTFGCESGQPTFRYSLLDGVRDGFLINPVVVDARSDITTQLLSKQGYAVTLTVRDEETGSEEEVEQLFAQRDFEKKFFSDTTNRLFCEIFLTNALRDPISNEIGKSIVFAVSQPHASKLTQILNQLADQIFPGKYQSDFALQVTSQIADAQQFTINFANNNLLGSANFIDSYRTSKTRVCVTVGMMTTGYDCPDLLNLAMMRPIFSPTDFIQIKGRGTRKHTFTEQLLDAEMKSLVRQPEKRQFKLFDFFANCEYFEEEFDYDEVLKLPTLRSGTTKGQDEGTGDGSNSTQSDISYESTRNDQVKTIRETQIGAQGMKIDRMFFQHFEERVKQDATVRTQIESESWEQAEEYIRTHIFDQPNEYYTLDKLRKAAGVDRRLSLREILQHIFGLLPYFKSKDEMIEDAFEQFLLDQKPSEAQQIMAMKYFFKAYISDGTLREIVDNKRFTELHTNPSFSINDFKAVPNSWRERIPEYIKDYVPLNQFM